MAKQKRPPKNAATRVMDATTFVREYAARQQALLAAMAESVKRGEIALENSERADRYIETVTSAWCSQAEPSQEAHLDMLGAVFLWALLDAVYLPERAEDEPQALQTAGHIDLALEALKTIRAIWGKER